MLYLGPQESELLGVLFVSTLDFRELLLKLAVLLVCQVVTFVLQELLYSGILELVSVAFGPFSFLGDDSLEYILQLWNFAVFAVRLDVVHDGILKKQVSVEAAI